MYIYIYIYIYILNTPGSKESDFVKQMVTAASVAFGGMKKGDYPKVGVSGYSA